MEEAESSKSDKTSEKSIVYTIDSSNLYIDDPKKDIKTYDVTSISSIKKPVKEKEDSFWKCYKRMYAFADSTDCKLMAVGLIASIIQAVVPPFVWLIMGNFVTLSISREEIRISNSTSSVYQNVTDFDDDRNIDSKFESSATPAFMAMLALSLTMFFAAFVQRLAWEVSGIRQVFRIKRAYVRKLLHMDVAWLESRQSGHVASMIHEHADSVYNAIADHMPMILFISIYLIVNIFVCMYIQWDVMLLMCTAIPLLISSRILFSRWFAKTLDEENKLQCKITNLVHETFSCIRTVIAFAAQRQTIVKFERLSHEHNQLTEQRLRSSTVYDSLTQVLLTELVFTAALSYGIWRVGDKEPGALCAVAINMLYMCVTSISIGFHMNGAGVARGNAKEMGKIFKEASVVEPDRCYFAVVNPFLPIPTPKYRRQSMKFMGKGAIEFRNIGFCYPTRPDVQVLRNFSLSIDAGERVSIVGPSGSGKSTLTALLLRFYDPQKGNVYLDGDNIRNICPDDLRAQLSLVSQEPVLFDGTISDNIRYGRLDATQQEINAAARKVGAWEFISALPMGMQTRVGDRGIQLSGGQKQRVAIARAVIRKPTVLIFDEATSALDNKHEEEVCQAIDLASEGLTTISIAHRLSTAKTSDRVIVIDDGMIVEDGPPDELLAREGGRFRKMYMDQSLDQLARNPIQKPTLMATMSVGSADTILDPESHRRAWARRSLGHNNKLGKSYSIKSQDGEKLALPVMSKKRSARLDYKYSNVGQMDVDVSSTPTIDEDEDFLKLPGHKNNYHAVWSLIKGFKEGQSYLIGAIPTTIVRAFFYLLICFQVASVLELSIVPVEDRPQEIFMVSAVYTALIIIKTIFEAMGRLFIALYGHGICSYMRTEMFSKIMRHGTAYFDEERNNPGRLVHKIISDSETLNKIMEQKLDLLIPAFICSIFSIIVALYINWKMALLCSFQFPAYFIIRVLQIKEGSKRQRQMMEEEKKAASLITIVLSNMSTIKAYNLQEHFYSVFTDALKPLSKAMKRQSVISAFVFACQYSFTYILIAITLHFGKIMMISNEISVFDYMRVVLLTQFGANFFSQLIASVTDFSKARVAAESVMGIIKEAPVDMDNLSEEGLRPKLQGTLQLHNVHFRYPSRPVVPILKGVDIRVDAGASIALVGPSGSGKSSIIGLFQRMYSPTDGCVTIDRHDVRSINPSYLRRFVVSVGQEPTLFSFTIKENIAYGLLESESTLDKVIAAAKIANIHDFISTLPQGYNTEVGEFGAQLSGGQKQRIAIARAIIRKPAVLLLDEATAALDSGSEKAVKEAFQNAKETCTCVHIAHRLSSIRNVDRIYVIVDGRVAEEGNHDELIALKSLYYEMTQASL
ncbi:unnamed protein product [Auanema sp. JU1783]|nr:unnamed protein product [Auanema sp. JU1783]